ncbi:MAG: PAS domain-containing protein [Microvirga sp.]|nr:PAS domain-containing protein [Microvirga sp.]
MEAFDAWRLTDDLHLPQGQSDPFSAAIRATRMPMIVTDPHLPGNPIIFANEAFLKMTGYSRSEVNGKNYRFLEGADTDPETIEKINKAIEAGDDIAIDVLSYRKDGTPFWNALYMSPVHNALGEVQYFFASQVDATERKQHEHHVANLQLDLERQVSVRTKELEAALEESTQLVAEFEQRVAQRTKELEDALSISNLLLHEVDHRVKNNLQMISAMLMLQSLSIPDESIKNTLQEMLERIEAMGLVHKRLYQSDNIMDFDLGEFTREIATNLVGASGRSDIGLVVHAESVKIKADDAASVALVINETITNALKHAFPAGRAGDLRVSVKPKTGVYEIAVEDNGVGMSDEKPHATGFGRTLIETLVRQLRASIEWTSAAPGTCVRIMLPIS